LILRDAPVIWRGAMLVGLTSDAAGGDGKCLVLVLEICCAAAVCW